MRGQPVLVARDLIKTYGGVAAVNGVSFTIPAGEVVALIGSNGAGKSTCFNMLSGQPAPSGGTIEVLGRDTSRMTPRAIWRRGVGRTFQVTATLTSMSVRENVVVALLSYERRIWSLRGVRDPSVKEKAHTLLERVGLREDAGRPASDLASGDLKRLELAIALANRPKLLLMTSRLLERRLASASTSCG